MNYTITTRARRHGIFFGRHELAPIGITDDATCWGLWVEGHRFDENSLLNTPDRALTNETPQLGISAIHPSHWPAAFNVDVLLERRAVDNPRNPRSSDALLGFADALDRCGVNILQVRTAQLGYNLVSVSATCEIPRLRAAISALVQRADDAGQELERARADLNRQASLTESARLERLAESDDFAWHRRSSAFQALGLLIIPELAELEMRLLSLDYFRTLQHHARSRDGEGDSLAALAGAGNILGQAAANAHWLQTGRLPHPDAAADERHDAVVAALDSAWFLNRKLLSAGENSYFLTYAAIESAEARRAESPQPGELVGDAATQVSSSEAMNAALLAQTLEILRGRHLRDRAVHRLRRSTAGGSSAPAPPRSATAERVAAFTGPADFGRYAYRDFFWRQALVPVRVSALPSLAHMRFWALAGARDRGSLLQWTYRDQLLSPNLASDRAAATRSAGDLASWKFSRVFDLLNSVTGLDRVESGDGRFSPGMAVIANLNLRDRFARLRFCRESVERGHYLTMSIDYHLRTPAGKPYPSSQGLLRACADLMVRRGFRIEGASNSIAFMDESNECGSMVMGARAVLPEAIKLCSKLPEPQTPEELTSPSVLDATRHEWEAHLTRDVRINLGDKALERLHVHLSTGFVPPNR